MVFVIIVKRSIEKVKYRRSGKLVFIHDTNISIIISYLYSSVVSSFLFSRTPTLCGMIKYYEWWCFNPKHWQHIS